MRGQEIIVARPGRSDRLAPLFCHRLSIVQQTPAIFRMSFQLATSDFFLRNGVNLALVLGIVAMAAVDFALSEQGADGDKIGHQLLAESAV